MALKQKNMQRNYDYHDSRSSINDYLERITRMQRMPTMISDFPQFPNVHEILDNNSKKMGKRDDQSGKISRVNHEKRQSPEVHKKVHFVEVERDGKSRGGEDKTIDAEADGFIQKKHNNFELCKWDTFKEY